MDVQNLGLEQPVTGLPPRFAKEGLTFDDVLLVPAESSVLPNDVSTATLLTRTIALEVPVVSAAMDTITDSRARAVSASCTGTCRSRPRWTRSTG
jgi:hypothetical protein